MIKSLFSSSSEIGKIIETPKEIQDVKKQFFQDSERPSETAEPVVKDIKQTVHELYSDSERLSEKNEPIVKAINILNSGEPLEKNHTYRIDGIKYETDDNGEVFRVGNQLLPNHTYVINGYTYKTDGLGRKISAEGTLQEKDHENRLTIKDSKEVVGNGDQKDNDDRGHLIADQFNGGNGMENLVPMAKELNQGDYKKLENMLADAVKDGADVKVKVEVLYDDDSSRPSAFRFNYEIDGEKDYEIFSNGGNERT